MAFNSKTNMYEGYIYKISCDIDDKIYIGQTTRTIKERWDEHRRSASMGTSVYLYNAMRKIGIEHFYIEQLYKFSCLSEDELLCKLNSCEIETISKYNTCSRSIGYNIKPGGSCNHTTSGTGKEVYQYDIFLHLINKYPTVADAARDNNITAANISCACNKKYKNYNFVGGFIWTWANEKPIQPDFMIGRYSDKIITDSEEAKRLIRLFKLNARDIGIVQYNGFGEVINRFNDLIDASIKLNAEIREIQRNVEGKRLYFRKSVLRYEDEPFDKYPCSSDLRAVDVYDVYGNFVGAYQSYVDAKNELNINRYDIGKYIKNGSSCCGYLFVPHGQPLVRKVSSCRDFIYEMYDDNMNLIKTFRRIKDISKYINYTVYDNHAINEASINHTKLYGYYWKMYSGFPVTT